jgi:2',3'-cyclic-nucleotide 2'-phosphodiesterase (5'-nucleotidase family)
MNSNEYYSDQVPFTGVKKQRINIKLAVLITVVTMVVVALLIWAITTTVLASRRNPVYPNAPVVDDNPLILDIITYNDVYELNPVSIATPEPRGGCSRVATYIKSVKAKKKNPNDVLVLFGGDLISPSLMSTIFKGKQMIVANNMMGLK